MATAVSHIFMKNGNGKRENSQMDMDSDDPEFVPLSKRINNLHLHQTSGQSSHQQHHHHHHPHLHGHHPHGHGHDSYSLNGVIDNPGALSPNSPLSPHNSPSSGSHHHHNHDGRMGHTDPNFHCNNIPSPQDIDFQMRNACINSETSNFRSGASSHGSGMNDDDDISKSHNSTGLMYNQHHQNVNGLQLQRIDYNPSMDSSSNPHYYESNRELYLLYVERMSRTRQVLHPHFYEPQ